MNIPIAATMDSHPGDVANDGDQSAARHPMQLLMIAYNFPPVATAGVHRTLRFAKYLREFHCQPSVLTRNCSSSVSGEQLLAQVPSDIIVHRVGHFEDPVGKSRIGEGLVVTSTANAIDKQLGRGARLTRSVKDVLRAGRDLLTETPDQHIGWSRLAAKYALQLCRSNEFDVIYTTGPPHSTHLAGPKIHQRTGLPWVADFRDPWARRPWSKTRNPWGQRLLPYLESKVVRNATYVVLNNEASADDFRRAYPELPAEKLISIPNGYDPDLLDLTRQLADRHPAGAARPSNPHRTPVICHPGSLYGQRDPRSLLQAIAQLHREGFDIRFQQIGLVADRYQPDAIAKEYGIEHLVQTLPPIPHAEVMQYMAEADILLVIQPNGPLMVPGKLYEMLLFDKPLLGICDSIATSQVIDAAGCAWSVASRDVSAIAGALKQATASPSAAKDPQRLQARDQFDGRRLTASLYEVLCRSTADHQGKMHTSAI